MTTIETESVSKLPESLQLACDEVIETHGEDILLATGAKDGLILVTKHTYISDYVNDIAETIATHSGERFGATLNKSIDGYDGYYAIVVESNPDKSRKCLNLYGLAAGIHPRLVAGIREQYDGDSDISFVEIARELYPFAQEADKIDSLEEMAELMNIDVAVIKSDGTTADDDDDTPSVFDL